MKYLLIDAGNSFLKLSVMDHASELEVHYAVLDYNNLYDDFSEQLSDYTISNVILSNVSYPMVSHIISDVSSLLWNIQPHIVITEQNKYGVTTRYTNPRLLGSDRWLALIAARPETNNAVCVIDCGSAVTIDVLSKDNLHLGGFITPGLKLSRKTLGQNTGNIPLMENNSSQIENNFGFLATNTFDAITAGTLYQLSAYVEHIITEIKNEVCDNIECIITGGDAIIVQKLSSHHFVYREKLVLDGLNIVAKDLFFKDTL